MRVDVPRTVIAEDAERELADRIDMVEQKVAESDEADNVATYTYWSEYLTLLEDHLDEIQTEGLSEQTLHDEWEQGKEEVDGNQDHLTVEVAEASAKADVAELFLQTFFGYGPTKLDDVIESTMYSDDTIEMVGPSGDIVQLEVKDEGNAHALADTFLRLIGRSIDDLKEPNKPL